MGPTAQFTDMTRPTAAVNEHVEQLVASLRQHEAAAAEIRETLRTLRGKLAAAGKRAGPKARSGRKRKAAEASTTIAAAEPAGV